jgi:hypothetical protein
VPCAKTAAVSFWALGAARLRPDRHAQGALDRLHNVGELNDD